jgi:hypothetical protein
LDVLEQGGTTTGGIRHADSASGYRRTVLIEGTALICKRSAGMSLRLKKAGAQVCILLGYST